MGIANQHNETNRTLTARAVFASLVETMRSRNARWAGNGPDLSVLERAAELAEEAGEAVSEAKKLRRIQLGLPGNKPTRDTAEKCLDALEYEIGDVFVTALNLCAKTGIDPYKALQRAFNAKSEQLGFPERL